MGAVKASVNLIKIAWRSMLKKTRLRCIYIFHSGKKETCPALLECFWYRQNLGSIFDYGSELFQKTTNIYLIWLKLPMSHSIKTDEIIQINLG